MKKVLKKFNKQLVLAAMLFLVIGANTNVNAQDDKTILGAGSTFVYPLFSKMFSEYNKQTGVQVNYQSIGSGGGILQLTNKTVDFGQSDAPLKDDQAAKIGVPVFAA